MKKLSLIFLATFYLVCAIGVYVHAHFCGGELSSVSYFAMHDNADCGCGEEPADSDCCKDVMQFYKVSSHHDASLVKASVSFTLKTLLVCSNNLFFNPHFWEQPVQTFNSHAPPPYLFAKASKLIVNSVFRI